MKFSQKVLKRTENPQFLNQSQAPLEHKCHIRLNKLDIELYAHFKTVKRDELFIELANFYTDYKGHYLGVIDAFFALIQNIPLERADRFPIKELDFFLRDKNNISAFSGYSQEIYEILSIGESLKNKIYGEKKIGFQYDPKLEGEFFELSTSEQYDLLEEFFAYYIYPNAEFPEEIEVIDITENEVKLNVEDSRIYKILKQKLFIT